MQNTVLLYALLLTGVAVGWWLGQRFAHQVKKKDYPDFIPSIEYLLAATNDRTLTRLLEGQQIDEDSLDIFLKLGRTLRTKGETERAIHLHQSLFARTDLQLTVQLTLKLELALDYLDAGLLDRAERLLEELMTQKAKGKVFEEAALHLVELYEAESEWRKICQLYEERRLPKMDLFEKRVSHAYCELAERSVAERNFLDARQLCRQALKIHSQCGRAYVVQGNLAYGQGEPREAIRCYLRALELNSKVIISILPTLVDCFNQVNDPKGLLHICYKEWQSNHYVPALKLYVQGVATQQSPERAVTLLLEELAKAPSNAGFECLVELVVQHELQLEKLQLQKLYAILRAIVSHEPKFVCGHCGFKSNEFHWLCPSCKNWSTTTHFVGAHLRAR